MSGPRQSPVLQTIAYSYILTRLTQAQDSLLSRIERGKVPDLETFSKVCAWLRIDPGDVLGRPAPASPSSSPSEAIPAVHFKADRAISPKAAKALAELILAAQKMMAAKT